METETSYKHLKKIVSILDEPICILGGWAVYLTVNDNFYKDQGRNYLGSRDIDLGFHIDKNLTQEQLKNITISKSFRYYKEIHYETGKELTPQEAKTTPTYNIFTMFIDPIVDYIHPLFQNIFRFIPANEPLLRTVFKNKKYRKELQQFNKLLWLPTPKILLATKLKSIPNRTKDEKLVKDICDIYALSWYSSKNYKQIKYESRKYISHQILTKLQELMSDNNLFQKAQIAMDIDAETIKNLFKKIIS